MQVLEMEEAESLVGARKKISNRNNNSNNHSAKAKAAACALRNDFLPKVVVLACVILLGILYLSAKDDDNQHNQQQIVGQDGGSNGLLGDIEIKTAAPTMKVVETNAPTIAPKEEEKPAAEPNPTKSPTPGLETESDEVEREKDDDKKTEAEQNDDDDNGNPFGYSNTATILPLVDHPLLEDSDATKNALIEKYGKWHFWDGDEDNRPAEDYCGKFPNRDIPGDEFPDEAWQADAVYVNHILNDADQLIARTMEAIFVEYGHGKPLDPDGMAERMRMFHWSREDVSSMDGPPEKYAKKGDQGNGGWTTRRSFNGLVRRLLHAMMTQDTFTVVMGGHSAAAGLG